MTRIISWNINGFRSPSMGIYDSKKKRIKEIENESEKPNILKLIDDYNPDIICLSETKCQDIHEDIFNDFMKKLGYEYNIWNSSTSKKGYSGVAIFSKYDIINKEQIIIPGLEEDTHGRYIVAHFDDFILINAYVPNTGSFSKNGLTDREKYREEVWDIAIHSYLSSIKNQKSVIYCGDLNVVSDYIDIYNNDIIDKGKSAGVKVFEREGFNKLIELGYTDTFREKYNKIAKYTWWDPRSKARNKFDIDPNGNGWRLDYFLVSNKKIIKDSKILDEIYGSDHCPILLDI